MKIYKVRTIMNNMIKRVVSILFFVSVALLIIASFNSSLTGKAISGDCVDSDGDNVYIKGYINIGGKIINDVCISDGSGRVVENLCTADGKDDYKFVKCSDLGSGYSCKDGACVSSTATSGTSTTPSSSTTPAISTTSPTTTPATTTSPAPSLPSTATTQTETTGIPAPPSTVPSELPPSQMQSSVNNENNNLILNSELYEDNSNFICIKTETKTIVKKGIKSCSKDTAENEGICKNNGGEYLSCKRYFGLVDIRIKCKIENKKPTSEENSCERGYTLTPNFEPPSPPSSPPAGVPK